MSHPNVSPRRANLPNRSPCIVCFPIPLNDTQTNRIKHHLISQSILTIIRSDINKNTSDLLSTIRSAYVVNCFMQYSLQINVLRPNKFDDLIHKCHGIWSTILHLFPSSKSFSGVHLSVIWLRRNEALHNRSTDTPVPPLLRLFSMYNDTNSIQSSFTSCNTASNHPNVMMYCYVNTLNTYTYSTFQTTRDALKIASLPATSSHSIRDSSYPIVGSSTLLRNNLHS
eukprot:259410_1